MGAAAAAPDPAHVIADVARELRAGGCVLALQQPGAPLAFHRGGDLPASSEVAAEKLIFEIGSITKVFTGLLLAQTVVDGKATLADPIAQHLPPDLPLTPEVAAITLEQLSSHTSGLPRLPPMFAPGDPADPYADFDEAGLLENLRTQKIPAPPHAAAYSNYAQGLLGYLLGRIHGTTYATLVATRITGPLGMHDTGIVLDAEQRQRFAPPHSGAVTVKPWHLDALAGAGALRSTAHDLVLFAQAVMDTQGPLRAAWHMASQPRAEIDTNTHFGLGVMMRKSGEHMTYFHGGGTGGFRTHLEFTPTTGTINVALINNDSPEGGAVVARLRPASNPGPRVARTEVPIAPDALAIYAGIFEIDAQRKFTVVVHPDGALVIRLTGQVFAPVSYGGGDRFFSDRLGAEFQFDRDANQTITGVTLRQRGREIAARKSESAPPPLLFPTAAELAPLVGEYELAPALIVSITTSGRQLYAKLTGQPVLPVFQTAPDRFEYDVVAAALAFERDGDGKVTAIVLHQNGQTPRAPRISE